MPDSSTYGHSLDTAGDKEYVDNVSTVGIPANLQREEWELDTPAFVLSESFPGY